MIDEYIEDAQLIRVLRGRGYIVRHKSEAQTVLSWNRTEPFPDGINFETEALAKIKEQITADMLEFEKRPDPGGLVKGIRSAKLRVLR